MRKVRIRDKLIGDNEKVFIIAEAGNNHNGELSRAREMVDVAAWAGADAVKFQLFRAEELYPENCGPVGSGEKKFDLIRMFRNMELPEDWIDELARYSESRGIIFLCSVFDTAFLPLLEKHNAAAYKIASPELVHIPLLEAVAKLGKPMILSTGLNRISDVEEAVETCMQAGNDRIILMHCVTAYPAPRQDCNLNSIATLKLAFELPAGFSDHTLHPVHAPLVATALGANIIEKHFTLSRKLPGPDHAISLEPGELKEMVRLIRKLENVEPEDRFSELTKHLSPEIFNELAGSSRKTITSSEKDLSPLARRSIHAVEDIESGMRLTENNVKILRSAGNLRPGLHPRYYRLILGKKLVRGIKKGQGITWENLLE